MVSVLFVCVVFSGAAAEVEVANGVSLIEVIWLVEFVNIRDRLVVELVVLVIICSVVVVGGAYGTTTTLNNTWAEVTTPPFIAAIK
jgi:hypothetical protein